MDNKIVFATSNKNKVKEAREILGRLGLDVITLAEAGITADVEENGTSFAENALIKAKSIAKVCNSIVIADDSGLAVDYINGEPGIYSARYMGEGTSYDIKNANIIERLAEAKEEERTARFVCAMAAVLPNGKELVAIGTIEGMIAHETHGENGFGYDPIFYVPEFGKTTAEMTMEEKNKISHRGQALEKLCRMLEAEK